MYFVTQSFKIFIKSVSRVAKTQALRVKLLKPKTLVTASKMFEEESKPSLGSENGPNPI